MIPVILCGGLGLRCKNYSLPKPLNYIQGRHMIEYIIESIPTIRGSTIYIIYNIFLDRYNFREIVTNLFKDRRFHFSRIDYNTRGAVETAFVGLQNFVGSAAMPENENIVFIDNDNIHTFPAKFPHYEDADFIGYSTDTTDKSSYSFVEIDGDGLVTKIVEKVKISDNYCCGIYGFRNRDRFMELAREALKDNDKTLNEFYFSQLYARILQSSSSSSSSSHHGRISAMHIANTRHMGSLGEIVSAQQHPNTGPEFRQLRICFDLDNTLVTFPQTPNDYSTVLPIHNTIGAARQLKARGHEIIIYTARRMKTHKNNVGAVVADIAAQTIRTLDEFGIPYDELIFGKPMADIYVDDRAANPYRDDSLRSFGLFLDESPEFLPNLIAPNKNNTIERSGDYVLKTGPPGFMRGETHFYRSIAGTPHARHFPVLHESIVLADGKIRNTLDFVNGIPLFHLYKKALVTPNHLRDLVAILESFHGSVDGATDTTNTIPITDTHVRANYIKKLEQRFAENKELYEEVSPDAQTVLHEIIAEMEKHYSACIVPLIHGDFWFSNILLTYDDRFRFIDMKGQVDGVLTVAGDKYYDYCKLLQSVIGYDLVLNGCDTDSPEMSAMILQMTDDYLGLCASKGLNVAFMKSVTRGLIFGNFPFLCGEKHGPEIRRKIWKLVVQDKTHG